MWEEAALVVTLELVQLKSYGVGSKCCRCSVGAFKPRPLFPSTLLSCSHSFILSVPRFLQRFYQTLCEAVSERLRKQQLEMGRKKGVLRIFQERPQTVHSGNRNNFLVHRVPPS